MSIQEQGAQSEQDAEGPDKPTRRRITADLPTQEFEVLEDARVRQGASTTDITRALLRLYDADPKLVGRVEKQISAMRQEKLEARRKHGRIWHRRRGATPHALLRGASAA